MQHLKKRYQQHMMLTSTIIALFIFLSGIALGFVMDRYRVNDVLESLRDNELDTESYFLEQQFIQLTDASICDTAEARTQALSIEMAEIGSELNNYKAQSLFKKNDYDYLLRRYFLLEIRTFALFEDINEKCGDITDTIVFFYEVNDDDSVRQGFALDEVARINKEVAIFSFDINYEEDPILTTLKNTYDIGTAPTIIINGDYKSEGYMSTGEIRAVLLEDAKDGN